MNCVAEERPPASGNAPTSDRGLDRASSPGQKTSLMCWHSARSRLP
jgi:hypothetical protein